VLPAPIWPRCIATVDLVCALRVVFYNRANEAAAQLKPGDFDWKAIFDGGVRWVHSGGIFAALSPTTAELAAEMMKEAKAAGAITSFDLNFREKLWKISGGNERAVEIIGRIVENVDVLLGNEEDLQKGWASRGRKSRPSRNSIQRLLRYDRQSGEEASPSESGGHPRCARCTRAAAISWSAVAWIDGKTFTAPTAELEVADRVGGGDGFASGFIYGLLTGEAPGEALKLGWRTVRC